MYVCMYLRMYAPAGAVPTYLTPLPSPLLSSSLFHKPPSTPNTQPHIIIINFSLSLSRSKNFLFCFSFREVVVGWLVGWGYLLYVCMYVCCIYKRARGDGERKGRGGKGGRAIGRKFSSPSTRRMGGNGGMGMGVSIGNLYRVCGMRDGFFFGFFFFG
ncbi:hypothetical protein F4809DRAFT_608198 [Biscogniauxia mediterranea]|nr:hypothetical protein F4809DRAFT_608198 [Biscogniauxia mediterranea]